MSFFKVNKNCNGCLACVENCPASALRHVDKDTKRELLHNMALCSRCGNCWRICPQNAVEFRELLNGGWDHVAEMELVHCVICGEPLYTEPFEQKLSSKLNFRVESLCPTHRKAMSVKAWSHLAPDDNVSGRRGL